MVPDIYRNPRETLYLKLQQLHLPVRYEKTFPKQISLSRAVDGNLSQDSLTQVSRCPENQLISK